MYLSLLHPMHLTYCTNIHAGETWLEIAASLDQTIPAIKTQLAASSLASNMHHVVAQNSAFGIGLRLSGQAAASLLEPATLQAFQAQLQRLGAYVFSINAFPYGAFHAVRVKEQVYLPDWRDDARLAYTTQCARILAQLLPDGVAGSISTVPGAFKSSMADEAAQEHIVNRLILAVAMLAKLEVETGKTIALALEPEPCCFLETVSETLTFFREQLWSAQSLAQLADCCAVSPEQALCLMRRHLGVCYDVCHAAVEFEDPVTALEALCEAGIAIPKIQLSCALRIAQMTPKLVAQLQAFDNGVYLHQVVVQEQGQTRPSLQRFVDLPQALAAFAAGHADGEWRIHCHVPIFWDSDGVLGSTRASLLATLQALRKRGFSQHLEVETYTWDVLPPHMKGEPKAMAIARELGFILKELAV
jgi:hypothetical protein